MATISLQGLNKAEVLAALYNASKPQRLGFLNYDSTPMTVKVAERLLKRQTYFDYLEGRVMKVDLSGDTLDTWGYDRDNGEGAAAAAIASLVRTGDVNNEAIAKNHSDRTFQSAVNTEQGLGAASGFVTDPSEDLQVFNLGLDGELADRLKPLLKKAKDDNADK